MRFKNRLNRWDEHGRYIMVQVEVPGRRPVEISVSQSTSLDTFEPEPATINWPGIGSVDPDTAEAFAAGLAQAAEVARRMESVKEWKRPERPDEGKITGANVTWDHGKMVVLWELEQE